MLETTVRRAVTKRQQEERKMKAEIVLVREKQEHGFLAAVAGAAGGEERIGWQAIFGIFLSSSPASADDTSVTSET